MSDSNIQKNQETLDVFDEKKSKKEVKEILIK